MNALQFFISLNSMKFSNYRNYSALIFCIIVLISMSGCFHEEGDKGIIADNKAPSIADIPSHMVT